MVSRAPPSRASEYAADRCICITPLSTTINSNNTTTNKNITNTVHINTNTTTTTTNDNNNNYYYYYFYYLFSSVCVQFLASHVGVDPSSTLKLNTGYMGM